MEPSVLIVDDERNVRLMYRTALENMCRVDDAASAARALEMLTSHCYDVAILDLRLPETTGLELLQQMNAFRDRHAAIFVTAFADVPNAVNAMKCGAIDFLRSRSLRTNSYNREGRSRPAIPRKSGNPRPRMI